MLWQICNKVNNTYTLVYDVRGSGIQWYLDIKYIEAIIV